MRIASLPRTVPMLLSVVPRTRLRVNLTNPNSDPMNKSIILTLLASSLLLLTACQSTDTVQKVSPYTGAASAEPKSSVTYGGGDGTSPEQAVIIQGTTDEQAGVRSEYAWIRQYYPGAKIQGQSLNMIKGKAHDVFSIKTASGEAKKLYFDISGFFGKAFGL